MILELRTYTAHPGKTAAWLEYYEKNGLALQQKYLGRLVGFFTSEIGTLNQIVHMWAFDSFADRERRRKELAQDPAWQAFLKNNPQPPLLISQESQILNPTSFSPLK